MNNLSKSFNKIEESSLANLKLCLLFLFLIIPCCADLNLGTDTLLQGQELRDGQYLESERKQFRLQFFSPGPGSKNRYLRVFSNLGDADSQSSPDYYTVWIANRNSPVPDSSGTLMINSTDGRLMISHSKGKSIVLSTHHTLLRNTSRIQTAATLLDNGNFVLREMNSDGNSINETTILWQSFDYPTDKFIPGMKLGVNFKTGHKWSLTSWISDEVPGSGSFTVGGDPNGTNQLVMWWQENEFWKSGMWKNGRFDNTPDLLLYEYINFSYIVNQDEKYLTYSVKGNNQWVTFGLTQYGHFARIGEKGVLVDCSYTSAPAGCVKFLLPKCRNGKFDFQAVKYRIYGESNRFDENYNLSYYDCAVMCMRNCKCLAFASINNDSTGCEIWNEDKGFSVSSDMEDKREIMIVDASRGVSLDTPELHVVPPLLEPMRKKWWIWLIAAVGGSGTILALTIIIYSLRRKLLRKWKAKDEKKLQLGETVGTTRRGKYKNADDRINKKTGFWCYLLQRNLRVQRKRKEEGNVLLGELGETIARRGKYNNAINKIENKLSQVQLFSFTSIELATNKFSAANKLGEGGFGPVYKGELPGGQEIAIKRLSRSSGQGLVEFKNEILLIAKLQHDNLVRLIGYCNQGQEKMLVYEYMSNKSLDFFLFDSRRRNILKWTDRMNIIEGVAQGLLYLHKYSRLKVIHRDLKASNILLDQNMNPRISDFGMARIFGKQESEANTKRIVGTHGYMSPEYFIKGIVSVKTDVFSFGVLILEIVSGKKNHGSYHSERPLNLIGMAWELWIEGRHLELMDPTILENSNQKNEVIRCINVGLLCVQDNASDRPSMMNVISMLTNELLQLPTPKQPAFFIKTSTQLEKEVVLEKKCTNDMSNSVMEAR